MLLKCDQKYISTHRNRGWKNKKNTKMGAFLGGDATDGEQLRELGKITLCAFWTCVDFGAFSGALFAPFWHCTGAPNARLWRTELAQRSSEAACRMAAKINFLASIFWALFEVSPRAKVMVFLRKNNYFAKLMKMCEMLFFHHFLVSRPLRRSPWEAKRPPKSMPKWSLKTTSM